MNELIERDTALQTLRDRLQSAGTRGHVCWIAGEAGIGKTSVLRRLAAGHPAEAVWWGACDALQTPNPLSPLYDIARDAPTRFATALGGPRNVLFEAVLEELRFAASPVLVVIEDAHWADDATLDFIKFLGRRIERTHALMAVSFRDDEVTASHPLRRVIGELPGEAVTHVGLACLSPAAVEQLARRVACSPQGLYAATHGNPFFVTELLRQHEDEVPRTVQDLVMARFARLRKPAQAIVQLASIVPARIERWLVDALLTPAVDDLEACLDSGLLLADGSSLSFRHELARVAVESSLTQPVAQSLHAQVLAALVASGRAVTPARLVHHAANTGDAHAVCRLAPEAAEQARERGAHREAAAHWRTALAHADLIDDATRAQWLEASAIESAIVARMGEAIAAREQLAVLLHRLGQSAGEGLNLCRLAYLYVRAMRNAEGDALSRRGIELLETLPPGVELASAYHGEAVLRMLNRDCDESVQWARKAAALSEALGDRVGVASARAVLGTAMMFIDYAAGCDEMMQALASARELDAHTLVATTLGNLGTGSGELFRFAEAERWLREGLAFAASHELDESALYLTAWLALCDLYRGRWDEAAAHASEAIERTDAAYTQVMALVALGRLRVRRGDPGALDALDPALALAEASGTLQRIAPVRAARAEAAFKGGDQASAIREAEAALPLAQRYRHPWFIGELAYWCWRGGALHQVPDHCAGPFALQIDGRWREAAAAWEELGCPYEQARALADGDDAARREALLLFERIGARPAADALRQRLREAGVRGVARGARASTRETAYGLTARELEVLRLLCEGLRNAEIAARLNRSVRTIDHHLAAVFAKLGVDTRLEAIRTAERAGVASGRERENGQKNGQVTTPN